MQNREQIEGVELKFICNENWDKMHPVEGGRHCDVCNKKVVDFTTKDQNDFTKAWEEAEGKLCGRFKAKQTVHLPQFRFDKAAAVFAAGSALLLSAASLSAQKTVGKIAPPTVKGELPASHVVDSSKRVKPPVIINKPIKKRWEECVMLGDTIAPIEPPIDTIPDSSSRIQPPVPNMDMLGGPKMVQPVKTQEEFLKGNIKEPINIEVMGKPSPQPIDTTESINLPEQPVKIFDPIEPEPLGGTDAMNDFIDTNIRWPEKLDHNLTVFVQVRIDKEGKVFNAYIIRGFRADVDSEAIRVARLIKFTPAKNQFGVVTESVLTIPVNFTYRQH
jgi:TonB family protein